MMKNEEKEDLRKPLPRREGGVRGLGQQHLFFVKFLIFYQFFNNK